ncbi:MAG: DUF882 domain-containing protein, partial [Limnobacter sp.]|nr:DUF882 domain-containing protein [Limnobacter sp.]
MKSIDRRDFFRSVAALGLVGASDYFMGKNALAWQSTPPPDLFDPQVLDLTFWLQPRTIDWVRPQSRETVSITYWKDGNLNPFAYEQICDLLRDVQANRVFRMDTQLIDTL